jgi:hypothetical protein
MTRIALLTAALFAVTAFADDKKSIPDDKIMEAMMKLGTPGPHHKALDPLAGDYTYTAKFWMAPGAPPMEMKGEDKCKWILDGRFLHDEVTGPAQAGMPPFHGLSVMGYDNASKKYQASWIDNMGTTIVQMTGKMDETGKVLTLHYEEFDPTQGKNAKAREVIHIGGDHSHNIEFYRVMADGKEMKVGEINCTRK